MDPSQFIPIIPWVFVKTNAALEQLDRQFVQAIWADASGVYRRPNAPEACRFTDLLFKLVFDETTTIQEFRAARAMWQYGAVVSAQLPTTDEEEEEEEGVRQAAALASASPVHPTGDVPRPPAAPPQITCPEDTHVSQGSAFYSSHLFSGDVAFAAPPVADAAADGGPEDMFWDDPAPEPTAATLPQEPIDVSMRPAAWKQRVLSSDQEEFLRQVHNDTTGLYCADGDRTRIGLDFLATTDSKQVDAHFKSWQKHGRRIALPGDSFSVTDAVKKLREVLQLRHATTKLTSEQQNKLRTMLVAWNILISPELNTSFIEPLEVAAKLLWELHSRAPAPRFPYPWILTFVDECKVLRVDLLKAEGKDESEIDPALQLQVPDWMQLVQGNGGAGRLSAGRRSKPTARAIEQAATEVLSSHSVDPDIQRSVREALESFNDRSRSAGPVERVFHVLKWLYPTFSGKITGSDQPAWSNSILSIAPFPDTCINESDSPTVRGSVKRKCPDDE